MILGIDGRVLEDIPISGVGEYTENFLKAFKKKYPEIECRVFFRPKWIPSKVINSLFRLKILSLETFFGHVDHILLPNHNFTSLKKNSSYSVVVHDLSFFLFPEYFSCKGRIWHTMIHPFQLYRGASSIIAVSESTKRDLLSFTSLPPEKITVIYPGISEKFFNFVSDEAEKQKYIMKYNLPKHYVLFLSTLEYRKNVLGVLRAFEKLKKFQEWKDIFLVISGKKGYGFDEIEKTWNKSPVKNWIRFLGYVDSQAKPYLYSGAKMFLYPSFYEGFGFPPLEAMALGVPVVVSSVSSLPEITRGAAITVNPFDPYILAHAMQTLLRDQELVDILKRNGREVARQYSWDITATKIFNLIEGL